MKNNKAFSMIELSVIVIVIGILLAGIIKGNNLYTKSKLRIAQRLTTDSPIAAMPGLLLWYETTLNKSFAASERRNNASISTWNDIKDVTMHGSANNATHDAVNGEQPLFIDNAFGTGIAGVRFDGTDDYLEFTETNVVNNFIIFMVIKSSQAHIINSQVLSGDNGTSGEYFLLFPLQKGSDRGFGISAGTNGFSSYEHGDNAIYSPLVYNDSSVGSDAVIIAFSLKDKQHNLYYNGVHTQGLTSTVNNVYLSASLGGANHISKDWQGDIAEVIAFNRPLKSKERKVVERYLSQKYGIAVTH